MSASLRLHDDILRRGCRDPRRLVFTTAGDSFAVAFTQASAAVDAAVAAQADLTAATWPGPALRVRMGLHLGEAEERGGDYFGPVVNACARVEAAGHGGQVLLTESVASVIERDSWSTSVRTGSATSRSRSACSRSVTATSRRCGGRRRPRHVAARPHPPARSGPAR